jgi:tRNA dimethylallyltransferase
LQLSEKFNGEIIAADSRTIYRYMDIGTAKPTSQEQARIPHHLIDVVDPSESFSAARFKQQAEQAINAISARGKLPFMVGGTGLYVDAVLYNFSFRNKPDESERARLATLSVEELQGLLSDQGISLPENSRNPRHLIRALETKGVAGVRHELRPNTLILGMTVDREVLKHNIMLRVNAMIQQGFLDEVRRVAGQYSWDAPALQAPGYKAFRGFFEGNMTLEEAKDLFIRNDLQLAKRQRTWFKRNKSIHWLDKREEAVDLITSFLNK